MKIKIILSSLLFAAILIIATGFTVSRNPFADEKPNKTECPYLQRKSENICPYIEEKVDKSNSECPYLSGKPTCPYSRKESKIETETSIERKNKELKFYRTIKNITS
jgi:hypothetical protein